MTLNKPILQNSVVEEVIGRITDSLIVGELKTGDRLPSEMELCRSLGVGRNSIREAIKTLTAFGVIEVKRGDGTYVSDSVPPAIFDSLLYGIILQRETPYELFELRKMYEAAAVEMAAVKAMPEDIERCRKAVDNQERLYGNGLDEESLLEADLAFHYAVLEACHNSLIERIGKTIFKLFAGSIKKALKADVKISIARHRQILAVIENHHPDQAKSVVENSLEKWREMLTF